MSEARSTKGFGLTVGVFCLAYAIVIFWRYFLRYSPGPILDVLGLAMVTGAAAFGIVMIWLHQTRKRSLGEPVMKQCAFALIWALLMAAQFGLYSYVWILAQIVGVATIVFAAAFLFYQIRFWRIQQS